VEDADKAQRLLDRQLKFNWTNALKRIRRNFTTRRAPSFELKPQSTALRSFGATGLRKGNRTENWPGDPFAELTSDPADIRRRQSTFIFGNNSLTISHGTMSVGSKYQKKSIGRDDVSKSTQEL
jgi:hypothetical protein